MKRRFRAGDAFRENGLRLRVIPGRKTEHDLRLDWWTGLEWNAATMAVGGLFADFYCENEDVLREDGYFARNAVGGQKYLDFVAEAARDGWRTAADRLKGERDTRRLRESGVVVPSRRPVAAGVELWPDGINPYLDLARREELLRVQRERP
jgi:hypothetical protein